MSEHEELLETLKRLTVKFDSTYNLCQHNPQLNVFLEKLEQLKTDAEHKELTDQLVSTYLENYLQITGLEVKNILLEFFTRCSTKKSLRKFLFDKFNTVTVEGVNLFEYITLAIVTEFFEDIDHFKIFKTKQCVQVLNFLYSYMQNFNNSSQYEHFMKRVGVFYVCVLQTFNHKVAFSYPDITAEVVNVLKSEECYTILDHTFKHLLIILVKINNFSVIPHFTDLLMDCHRILVFLYTSHFKYETTAKCALLLSHFLNHVPEEEKSSVKHKNFPIIDFLENDSVDFCLCLKSYKLENIFHTDKMKVVLYSAIFNSVDISTLVKLKVEDFSLLEFLYTKFIYFGKLWTGYPEQIILISRSLSEISDHLGEMGNSEQRFEEGLDFCWAHLEHFVESVVHAAKLFFARLIHWAHQLQDGEKLQLKNLFSTLNSMSQFSKVRLTALEIVCEKIDCDIILRNFENVQKYLLTVVSDGNLGVMAGNIYINLMEKNVPESEEEFIRIWIQPVIAIIRSSNTEDSDVYQKIVTHGFQIRPAIFSKLFSARYIGNSAESVVILRCIHIARMKAISLPVDPNVKSDEYWRDLIIKKKLEIFMIHQNDDVRLWVLQVIIESPKSTEEITEWEILYLLSYFSYNVSSQFPCVLRRICSLYKKLFARYQASFNVILRKISSAESTLKNNEKNEESVAALKKYERTKRYYRGFLLQFIGLMLNNLSPDASYSRRSLSLELLLTLRSVATDNEWMKSFTEDEVSNLKNLLSDSYDCNKNMTVSLLRTLPPQMIGFEDEKTSRDFVEKCLVMACDIKPSKSLTASYMLQVALLSPFPFPLQEKDSIYKDFRYFILMVLGEKLERMFQVCKGDVVKAARTCPFHGLLLSAKTLLKTRDIRKGNEIYAYLFKKLVTLCMAIKDHVMPIVSSASPEGYVPGSKESFLMMDHRSKSQVVQVFAWKSMKEITMLLAELVRQTVVLEESIAMVPIEMLLKIGKFFIDTFIQTRHRGVFETAYNAFCLVCQAFARSKTTELNELLPKWLALAMDICTGKQIDERICATRRSAGLPFLIMGVVSVEAETNTTYFQQTIEQLLAVASNIQEVDENRIHCLNTLRFMFINSKLGDLVPAYVGSGVIAALLGFKSKTWGVRNSATLLYSSLITRMFGVQRTQDSENLSSKNRMTLAVFYVRYPILFEFLLKTLSEECEKVDSLVLYPVLLILARLYPSYNDKINDQVQKHIPCINICISNSSYRIRDLAARASISLISMKSTSCYLMEVFTKISNRGVKDAECHGLLLQVWHLLRTNKSLEELPAAEYLAKSVHVLEGAGRQFSHLTVALYMEVISVFLIRFDLKWEQVLNEQAHERTDQFQELSSLELLKQVIILLSHQTSPPRFSTCRHTFEWNRLRLLLIIVLNKFQHIDITFDVVSRELIRHLYTDNVLMKRTCLYLFIYLNQVVSEDSFKEHPLITAGEVEIPSSIQELVNCLDLKSRRRLLSGTHHQLRAFFCHELLENQKCHSEYLVLVVMLMKFYTCIFTDLHVEEGQKVLDFFVDRANRCENEELASAIISTLNVFVAALDEDAMRSLDFSGLVKLLMKSASPSAANFRRLASAQHLANAQFLFRTSILRELDRYNMLNTVLVLLEDEEAVVRHTISSYRPKEKGIIPDTCVYEFIPDKIRSDIMMTAVPLVPVEIAVCFLVSWSVRYLPEISTDPDSDESEVFERGELNTFAENIPITYAACKVLNSLLWPLGEGLSYEDKSIFIEEQTLLVTTIILNSLIKVPSPMVDKHTKTSVICALKCITKFIENSVVGKDFQKNFKVFFTSQIVKYFRTTLTTDYSSVKSFFSYLYNPVLKISSRFPSK